jgi:hypothetical protein
LAKSSFYISASFIPTEKGVHSVNLGGIMSALIWHIRHQLCTENEDPVCSLYWRPTARLLARTTLCERRVARFCWNATLAVQILNYPRPVQKCRNNQYHQSNLYLDTAFILAR